MFSWKANVSFVIEPCRKVRYNPVDFSPILSYNLHNLFIGKSTEMEFSWSYTPFRKNDASKTHVFCIMQCRKKLNCIWICFLSKLHLCFDPKESWYWVLGNNPYRIHWWIHLETTLPNTDFPSLTLHNSPITSNLRTDWEEKLLLMRVGSLYFCLKKFYHLLTFLSIIYLSLTYHQSVIPPIRTPYFDMLMWSDHFQNQTRVPGQKTVWPGLHWAQL